MSMVESMRFEQPDEEYEGDFPAPRLDFEIDTLPPSEWEELDEPLDGCPDEQENEESDDGLKSSTESAARAAGISAMRSRRHNDPQVANQIPEGTTTIHESDGLSLRLLGTKSLVVKAEGVVTKTITVRKDGDGKDLADLWAATVDVLDHPRLREALENKVTSEVEAVSINALKSMLAIASLESSRFFVITEVLTRDEKNGVTLALRWSERLGLVLQVWKRGRLVSIIPVNVKQNGRTHYLQVTRTKVLADPILGPLVGDRIRDTKSNSVAVHDLVAIAGDGADLTLQGRKSGTHHRNLNGGDNRLNNLFVLSTGVHDEAHRAIDADPAGFENALRNGDDLAFFSEELKDKIWSDHESFTGRPLPSVNDDSEGNAKVEERKLCVSSGEIQEEESDYNPHGGVLTDISLNFDKGYMIASSTFPEVHPALDNEGNEKKNEWGQVEFTIKNRPRTVSSAGHDIDAKDPYPQEWGATKPFALNTIDDLPRWSKQDMDRFVKGETPSPDLAARIVTMIDERIAFTKPVYPLLIAAFIAMTFVFPLARRLPILAFHSMGPGMGKSTVLRLICNFVFNGIASGVTTLAAIVRLADQALCTLVLDEQEKLSSYKKDDSLIEIMNSRTDTGSVYTVAAGEGVKQYKLFGPTAVASLNGLSPSLQSRSIVIELRPMEPDDPRKDVSQEIQASVAQAIRGELMLWARANWKNIKTTMETDPDVRIGNNRQADLWRLLLAVSKHFGGKSMFEALRSEAIARLKDTVRDERIDAVVLALAKVIAEKSRNVPNDKLIFSLSYLHTNAQAIMEEDQRKNLRSQWVADFCRSQKLTVQKHHSCKNANAVFVPAPVKTMEHLKKHFPELLG